MVTTAKLTRLTHKIAIPLHLVAEICNICSFRSRLPVRKLLNTPSYIYIYSYFDTRIQDKIGIKKGHSKVWQGSNISEEE